LDEANFGDYSTNRAGYSMGVSFPPDWGEGDLFSLRFGESRRLKDGMVFHIVPSVVIPTVGEIGTSATAVVREGGGETLTLPLGALTVI
jgi:Xaa-Pro dipeptidase